MDITVILLFAVGCALLIGGAEVLVRHASALAVTMGIPPLIIGLTIVSYGTSAPELAVSVQSSYGGQGELAIGNLIGSNISNILLILGASAVVTPLVVSKQIIRLEVPLMIGVSIATLIMGWNHTIDRVEAGILFAGAVAYTGFIIYQSLRDDSVAQAALEELPDDLSTDESVKRSPVPKLAVQILWIVLSFGLLILGSRALVHSASAIARTFGFSELIIGLTVVAIGTSLPELATSVMASLKGEKDIAIGNVVGSNIFNLLFVMGTCGLVSPEPLPVAAPALRFDLPVMVAVAIACLPIFFTGSVVARWEGLLFLGYYISYISYLVFNATQHNSIEVFSTLVIVLVSLLTLVALMGWIMQMIRTVKVMKRRQRRKAEFQDSDS
jgi:cation:H+ antiporter